MFLRAASIWLHAMLYAFQKSSFAIDIYSYKPSNNSTICTETLQLS